MNSKVLPPKVTDSIDEQRVRLEGVSWKQYESLLSTLSEDFPALRMSYLSGALEIMTNSPLHEKLKKIIGMLIEAYLLESRTRFLAIGSATFREAAKQRGLEPDECYCIGEEKAFPDLAVEVVLSSGVINKLEIYAGLGVSEVWVWEAGAFTIHHLRSNGYEQLSCSELLPDCDVALLAGFIKPDEQFDAVMAYRDQLRTAP